MSSYFDFVEKNNPIDPSEEKYNSFLTALESVRRPPPPQAAPEAAAPPPPPPGPPNTDSIAKAGMKGLAGGLWDFGTSAVSGAGTIASSMMDDKIRKLAEISPMAQSLIYSIGAGDDTIAAMQQADLDQIMSGKGGVGQHDVRQTSTLYNFGKWAQAEGYETLGITPELQQRWAYKIPAVIGQVAGLAAEGAAVTAVAGPVAGWSTIMAHSGAMQFGEAYDQGRAMGLGHDEAFGIAGRNAVVMMALEAISMKPIMAGMQSAKAARAAGGVRGPGTQFSGVGAGALPAAVPTGTGASKFQQALMKRGFNIRNTALNRGVRTLQGAAAEGMEEALTGMHLDMELYRSATHWRPGKTWAQIVFGPQRIEEFVLGAIGGGVMTGALGGSQIEFSEARKESARIQYKRAANNDGKVPTDAQLEMIFRKTENRARNFKNLTQAEMLSEMEVIKEQGRRALSAEAEVEAGLLLDALAEMLPSAKSGSTVTDPAKARAAATAAEKTPDSATDAAAEEGAAARDMMSLFKRWGVASVDALQAGVQNVLNSEGFTGAQQKAARVVSRVLQKVKRSEAQVDAYNNQEAQADQMEQQARDMEAQVVQTDLEQKAVDLRKDLLKAYEKGPEEVQKVLDRHMHPDLPVELANGAQVDSRTVMSAYLDMPAPPGFPEGATMRDAVAQSLSEQKMMEQNAYNEQILELEQEIAKREKEIAKAQLDGEKQADAEAMLEQKRVEQAQQAQLQAQQAELKQQRLEQQALVQQLQFEQQLEEIEAKQQERAEKAELSQEKMNTQREKLAEKKKQEAEAKKKKEEDEKKYGGEKDRSRKKAMDAQYKRDAKKAVVENLRGRHPKPEKAREILKALPEKDAQEVLSTPLEKTGRSKKQAQRDKALNLTNVNDLLTDAELRAKAKKQSAKAAEKMKPDDPSNDQAPHPLAPKETDTKTEPIHKGKETKILWRGNKKTRARSGNTFKSGDAEMMHFEVYNPKTKKWEAQTPVEVDVFKQMMRDARPGRRPNPTPAQESTGVNPTPVTSETDNAGGVPPRPPNVDPPRGTESWSGAKKAWYALMWRLGDLVAAKLGNPGQLLRRWSLNSSRMSTAAVGRFNTDLERAGEWVRKTFGGNTRTEKGPAAKYRHWLLEMRDLRAEIADFRNKLNDGTYTEQQREWVEGEIRLRETALDELGFNPSELGFEANTNELNQALEYARRKLAELQSEDIHEDTGRKTTGKSPKSQLHRTKRVRVNMDLAKYDKDDGVYRVDREDVVEFLKDARNSVIPSMRPVFDGVIKLIESVPAEFRPDLALSIKPDGYLSFKRQTGTHTLGQYNGAYHEVVMPITEPGSKAKDGKQAVAINGKTLLHELIHAMTVDGITDNVGPYGAARGTDAHTDRLYRAQDMAADISADIRALMSEVEGHPEITGEDLDAYGFTNEKEFLAEALSNPQFQKILAKIPAPEGFFNTPSRGGKRSSVWHGIVETVRKMLKLPPGAWTALDAALKLSEEAAQNTERTMSAKAYNRRDNQRRYAKEDAERGDTPEVDQVYGNEARTDRFKDDTYDFAPIPVPTFEEGETNSENQNIENSEHEGKWEHGPERSAFPVQGKARLLSLIDTLLKNLENTPAKKMRRVQLKIIRKYIQMTPDSMLPNIRFQRSTGREWTVQYYSPGVDPKTRKWDDKRLKTAGGVFLPESNTVVVAMKHKPGNDSGFIPVELFVHEMVHAFTLTALGFASHRHGKGPAGDNARVFRERVLALMKSIKYDPRNKEAYEAFLKEHGGSQGDAYGFRNEMEFLAEAFSNPRFQDFLRSVQSTADKKSKPTNMFRKLKEAVADLLGLSKSEEITALDEALSLVQEGMDIQLIGAAETSLKSRGLNAVKVSGTSRNAQQRYKANSQGETSPARWKLDFEPESPVRGGTAPAQTRMQQEEALYWQRRIHYLEDLQTHHADAVVRVMHDIDSIGDQNLRKYLPTMNAARYHYNLAWYEKAKHHRRVEGETDTEWMQRAGKVPNHTYQGVSKSFLDKIKKNDPQFVAERNTVKEELRKILFPTRLTDENLAAAEKLRIELGISEEITLDQLDRLLDTITLEMLSNEASVEYSKTLTNFGSFIHERKGIWGAQVTDLSDEGTRTYLDRAYRDIAEEEMYREFYLSRRAENGDIIPPTDPEYDDYADSPPAYHQRPEIARGQEPIPDKKQAWEEVFNVARSENPAFDAQWLREYMADARGRQLPGDTMSQAMGWLAKSQYISKLGGLATLIRNATILGSMAFMLGPRNMLAAMHYTAFNWKEAHKAALESGAANPLQDATFEFESAATGTHASKLDVTGHYIGQFGLWLFTKEEMVLRTAVADASVRFYRMNVEALRGSQSEGDAKLFPITPEEARKNLEMLEFTKREIDLLEQDDVNEAEMLEEFEKRAMYHGSTLVNFRGGADFLPPLLVGTGSFQRFLRVFNSFAWNILVAQAKYIWKPIARGGADRRAGIRRGLAAYGGAMVTAELAEALISMIRPEDDEDEMYDGIFSPLLNNFNTVGLLGKAERPQELILDPIGFFSGVSGRSIKNYGSFAFEQMRAGKEILDFNFSDAAKQSMSAMTVLALQEISHARAMRDLYRQANPLGSNQKYYQTTRQVSRTRARAKEDLVDRWAKDGSKFIKSVYAPQRTKLVNALVAGKPGPIKNASKELVARMIRRDAELTPKDALQNARQSVMMYSPLSEFSRTSDVEKAKTELEEFRADMTERRGKKATERMIAMHLAYVEGVNLALPRTK